MQMSRWIFKDPWVKQIQMLINKNDKDHIFWNLGELCGGEEEGIYPEHIVFNPAITSMMLSDVLANMKNYL